MNSKSSPSDAKKTVRKKLYKLADQVDWIHLTIPEKQRYYETWTADPNIGGLLEQIMEPQKVRVYLKDSIMKTYSKERRLNLHDLLASMSLNSSEITREYIKPQALLCDSTDLFTISTAKEWRVAMLSAYERAYEIKQLKKNILFLINHTTGKYVDQSYRDMVESAGTRLNIRVHWVT